MNIPSGFDHEQHARHLSLRVIGERGQSRLAHALVEASSDLRAAWEWLDELALALERGGMSESAAPPVARIVLREGLGRAGDISFEYNQASEGPHGFVDVCEPSWSQVERASECVPRAVKQRWFVCVLASQILLVVARGEPCACRFFAEFPLLTRQRCDACAGGE